MVRATDLEYTATLAFRCRPKHNRDGVSKLNSEVVETRTTKFWLRDDGIVHAVDNGKFQVTLADAKENVAAALKVANGRRLPILIDITSVRSVTREARLYYRDEAGVHTTAAALLIGSTISRVIANFVIGLDRPVVPARIFTSETEAIQWLKGYLG